MRMIRVPVLMVSDEGLDLLKVGEMISDEEHTYTKMMWLNADLICSIERASHEEHKTIITVGSEDFFTILEEEEVFELIKKALEI